MSRKGTGWRMWVNCVEDMDHVFGLLMLTGIFIDALYQVEEFLLYSQVAESFYYE